MPKKQIAPTKLIKVVKFLEFIGLELVRTRGDHFIYNKHPKLKRPVIVTQTDPMPSPYIKKLLKELQYTEQEFLDFLENN
jgi:predicted RNA binding protein YcfA (HicA-like mRNA interferase family)